MRLGIRCFALLALAPWISACGEAPTEPQFAEQPAPAPTPAPTGAAPPATVEAAPPAAPPPAAAQLTDDTKIATPSGASTMVPKGWFRTNYPVYLQLEDPDRALRVFVLELDVADGAQAIAKAWGIVDPKLSLTPDNTLNPPAANGWEKSTVVFYKEPPGSEHFAQAVAQRGGGRTFIFLIEGKLSAADRRGAQINTIIKGLRAPGVEADDLSGKTAAKVEGKLKDDFEAFIQKLLPVSKVPGLAVAVVQGGKVVYEKGFGVRTLGKKDPVGPETRMLMGSVTKSLTSLLMAKLVDDGKLDWEAHVPKVLPGFALGDQAATDQILVRHTVCACTGMPRRDLQMVMEYKGQAPEGIVDAMKAFKPTTGFGETFQYSNQLVAVGGFAAAHAYDAKKKLGEAYDEAMKKLLFGPMGMSETTFSFAEAQKAKDVAAPHGVGLDGEPYAIGLNYEEMVLPLRPAGGAWSSVHDMSRWLITELSHGKSPDGKVVVSEKNLMRRWEPGVKIDDQTSYGLGLMVTSYKGIRMVTHGGNNIGFSADLAFLPDKDLGIVILTNANGMLANSLMRAVRTRLFELAFGVAKNEAAERFDFGAKALAAELSKMNKGVGGEFDDAWKKTFAGTYGQAELGTVKITAAGKDVFFDVGEWKSRIVPKKEDDGTISIALIDPPYAGETFFAKTKDGAPYLEAKTPQETFVLSPPAKTAEAPKPKK
jgi:CubicO group peptidase (beta-lactamase class C family)